MGKVSRDDYRLLKIADALLAINQRVNIIGVIVEYSIPKRSRGTDWFCSLRVVDETYYNFGLLVNIFAESTEKLPKVEASGDIVELSQVQMKTHNGDVYALFNKKFSSFALYDGKYGHSCSPYQSSSKFRSNDQEMVFVAGLRKWADCFQLDAVWKDSMLLRQIKEKECFDLVCKILHLCEVAENKWILFVWDGSDAPPLQIQSELETELTAPLPLQLEPQPLQRDTLCTFPTVGSILRIIVDQGNAKLNLPSFSAGRWAKFINLTFEVHEGFWLGVLTPSAKVRFVPSEDSLVSERQREFEKRLSSKRDRLPFTSFPWPARITEVDAELEEIPLVTLMDCMTYSKVTAKFKCIVRVVAVLPWKVEDFRSPSGTYRIRLTLEDPTARIHAYLYAEDAEAFFEGYPLVEELTKKWNTLLGFAEVDSGCEIEGAARNPSWIECCLKSYYLDKNDAWGSRRFRICNTKLEC